MALFTPSYGGDEIFGEAVKIEMVPAQTVEQMESFFGINGTFALFGGSRGRVFQVSGLLVVEQDEDDDPTTISDLNGIEANFLSYNDGVARTLFDTRGRSWDNVIFRGEFTPDSGGPRPTDFGWCLPYRAIFHGLT
jgi:hypothetical protein